MSRYKPALFGGLLIGVLSSIPLVSAGNVCCCLWVVCGGVLATYLLQQQTVEPVQTSDALLQGVLAGLIGGVIAMICEALLMTVTGPLMQEPIRRALEQNPDIPPETVAFIQKLISGNGLVLIKAVIVLPMYAIFAMLGALLGTAFFKKKVAVPPPAPPPTV